jgi:hypothetical protein
MTAVVSLELQGWRPSPTPEEQKRAVSVVEGGGVLVLPRVNFVLSEGERRFLSPRWSDGRAKNISLDGDVLKGASGSADDIAALTTLVRRFADGAASLVAALFPRYATRVRQARTSFRPQAAVGRRVSWRKDDSRLHVDAFPSRPNRGERILRVFSNVNPDDDRVWRVGEDFADMARALLPRIPRAVPGIATALALLHVTKGRRTEYDHLMLGLHDAAKADVGYQGSCEQQVVRFAPGTTWVCFSDQVMHAAVSGQYMLEQTIHLPVSALYDPASSPLAILQQLTRRTLVPA